MTETLLNTLPQTYPGQGSFISNSATGTATVDLRGFGPGRTLVLINGRRLLPGDAVAVAPDVNFIPSALIKRVEVLTGGASSVYGSDAVAGVINFIMETRLDGLRLDGQASFYQHDNRDEANLRDALNARGFPYPKGNTVDGGIQDVNAAFGHRFADGRGHATVYAGYRKSDAVTQDRRDYSSCTAQVSRPNQDVFCGGSFTNAPGNFFTQYELLKLGPGRTFVPGLSPAFNFAPYNYFQRSDRRYTVGGFADFEISDAIKPYLEVMYMDDRTVAAIAPSANFGNTQEINCDNPLLSAQQLTHVCFNGNFVGQTSVFDDFGNLVEIQGEPTPFIDPVTGGTYFKGSLAIARRNVEGGPRLDDLRHKDLRAIGGFEGELGRGASYDASYLYGRVKQRDIHTNDFSIIHLERALDVVADITSGQPVCRATLTGEDPDCVPWDVFELGAVTPEAAAYLNVPTRLAGLVEQRVANLNFTIDLGEWEILSPWAVDSPSFNIGAEYRKDTLELDPDEHYQAGDITGLGQPILPFSGSTKVKEMFGEARLPLLSTRLIEDLTVEVGYRQSWQSNPAHRFMTSSYKLAADLTPVRGLRLRASTQRAVRAPNIQELFAPTFLSAFDIDPCAGLTPIATPEQCANTGVTAAQYGHIVRNIFADFGGGYQSIVGGNAELEPETAKTFTAGLVVEPRFLPGFSGSLDWFDIKLNGAIIELGGQIIMDTCIVTGDPSFCERIHRDAQGSLWQTPQGFVDDTNINAGNLQTQGIDVQANYARQLGSLGSGTLQFTGTWFDRFIIDPGGLSTPFNCAGRFGYACGAPLPRWRHNARVSWNTRSGISLSLLWRHIGKVKADRLDPDVPTLGFLSPAPSASKISAREYFDLTSIVRLEDRYTLRLGVKNIFDREPPIVPAGNAGTCGGIFCNGNTYPQLYDPLGRFVFAGVTVDLNL